jgi:hypothetical protein
MGQRVEERSTAYCIQKAKRGLRNTKKNTEGEKKERRKRSCPNFETFSRNYNDV